ncbi:MAG: dockerin type I domain-containing protein [Caldilineaceae bacterium]
MAQSGGQSLREVRVIYPSEWGILNEGGLAYSTRLREFFVLKQGKPNAGASAGVTIATFTPYEKAIDSIQLNYSIDNATNIAFDDQSNSLYILNSAPAELARISIGSNGKLDPATLTRYNISSWNVKHADGIDIDSQTRQLFILDRKVYNLVTATLTADGPDSASVSTTSLAHLRAAQVRGLAVNPANHHLYTASKAQRTLYELDTSGQIIGNYDFGNLDAVAPRDMVFAPSADLTDADSIYHLFVFDSRNVADVGVSTGIKDAPQEITDAIDANGYKVFIPMLSGGSGQQEQEQTDANPVDAAVTDKHFSQLIELELRGPTQVAAAAIAATPMQLVHTIDTAAFSPPSPDPSGLTYLPNSNTILMSDGEVEETVNGITHFAGANVWEMHLDGTVVRSANVSKIAPTQTRMSNEPNGVTWNPNNGHYYFSDDDVPAWHDLNPGADQLIGTSDDTWVTHNTTAYNDLDPEGIAYDPINNYVYVSDGVNAEIYQYALDGTLVNHFDVAAYGVVDCESVEYNPYSGTLFVLSNWQSRIIVETTLNGALLNTFDISAVTMKAPAGLTYAPASNGSGQQRFYIADRAVDNNDNPNEVDGKIYEMTAPQPTGSPTNTPTSTSTATSTNTPVPPTATPTNTSTSTPTSTATNTPTNTPTATSTNTPVPPTATPTNTSTGTPTATATNTPTNTPTATSTNTPVPPTATQTNTSTGTPTATATNTPTNTPTATSTNTPVPPTATPTNTATNTPTATATDTATNTPTPLTGTPTDTATSTPTPTATSTGQPPTDTPTPTPTTSSTTGDINNDGNVNIFDLQVLINMIQHSPQPDTDLYPSKWWQRGDLFPDGQWNIFDLQLLINLIQQG